MAELAPHQQRVVAEQTELNEKLAKLTAFSDSEMFTTLDYDERQRLRQQRVAMAEYNRVLLARIEAFSHG